MPRLSKAIAKKPNVEALEARLRALKTASNGRLDEQGRSQQEQIAEIEAELAGKPPPATDPDPEFRVSLA